MCVINNSQIWEILMKTRQKQSVIHVIGHFRKEAQFFGSPEGWRNIHVSTALDHLGNNHLLVGGFNTSEKY